MRRLVLLGLVMAMSCLFVRAAPAAAAPLYRCASLGFQLPIPTGWYVLETQCGTTGTVHLFKSNDGNGLMFVISAHQGFDFTRFAQDMRTRLGAQYAAAAGQAAPTSAVTFGAVHEGGRTYATPITEAHGPPTIWRRRIPAILGIRSAWCCSSAPM